MGITEPLGWLAAPNAMIRSSRLTNGTLAATLSTVPSTFPSGIPLLLPDAADARFCSRLVTVVLVVPLREPARPFSTLDSTGVWVVNVSGSDRSQIGRAHV